MSVEEAIDLVDKCIFEIRSRLVVAPTNFVIKIVEKDCTREYAWRESSKDTPVIQLELILFLILIKVLYFRLCFNNSTFLFSLYL
jgi:20S proteasome subunit beta 4